MFSEEGIAAYILIFIAILITISAVGCEPATEPLYGPCGSIEHCGKGLTCQASSYGGDEGYCTMGCSTVDPDVRTNMCVYVDVCMEGCCKINYTMGGTAYGYCVPYPSTGD